MLTEDILSEKWLGCLDLVYIVFSLEKAGIKYKINKDGSLTIFNTDYALVQDYYDHKIWGYIGDVYIEGYLDVVTDYPKLVLTCNERSTRVIPDV